MALLSGQTYTPISTLLLAPQCSRPPTTINSSFGRTATRQSYGAVGMLLTGFQELVDELYIVLAHCFDGLPTLLSPPIATISRPIAAPVEQTAAVSATLRQASCEPCTILDNEPTCTNGTSCHFGLLPVCIDSSHKLLRMYQSKGEGG